MLVSQNRAYQLGAVSNAIVAQIERLANAIDRAAVWPTIDELFLILWSPNLNMTRSVIQAEDKAPSWGVQDRSQG